MEKRSAFRKLLRSIRGGELTVSRAAGSVGLGLFVGLLPLYGLHLPLCLGLSAWLSLDGLVAYAAANISNPILAPFIVMLEIEVGSLLFEHRFIAWDVESIQTLGIAAFTWHSLVGALVVATLTATLGALVTFGLGHKLSMRRKRRESSELARARRRTCQRYQNVRPKDRHYVRIKLLTDPLVPQLAQLPFDLGHVTDAGCGRGQFGLFLLELGRAQSLYGFDFDAGKVESAKVAAGGSAVHVLGDLCDPPLIATDTVLLFDVLHYLDLEAQHRLLRKAYDMLRPGGHLLLRDLDKNHGPLALLTRSFERLGTAIGINQTRQLVFRGSRELRSEILGLGFQPHGVESAAGGLLDNRLWVFRKPASPLRAGEEPIVTR